MKSRLFTFAVMLLVLCGAVAAPRHFSSMVRGTATVHQSDTIKKHHPEKGLEKRDDDKTGDHKEHAVQHLLREFEIPLTIDMANGKDALLHGAALLEQFLVGIFLGCT